MQRVHLKNQSLPQALYSGAALGEKPGHDWFQRLWFLCEEAKSIFRLFTPILFCKPGKLLADLVNENNR